MPLYMTANVYLNYTNIGYTGSQGTIYNEEITVEAVVKTFTETTVRISKGAPNSQVEWSTSTTVQTLILDDKGEASFTTLFDIPQIYILTFKFAASGHIKARQIKVVSDPWLITLYQNFNGQLQLYPPAPVGVNEGNILFFEIIAPPTVPENLIAYFIISDPATIDVNDITRRASTAEVQMVGRRGTYEIEIKRDNLTEGAEYFNVWVEYPEGFLVGTYGQINIADTSLSTNISLLPTNLNYATVGVPYTTNIIATGGTAPYDYEITIGTLPTGLALDTNGTLQGTPTVAGSSYFTVTATDALGNTGTQNYALETTIVNIDLSMPAVNGTRNVTYTNSVTGSSGKAPYSFAITSGSLPGGLSLSSDGTISGTATAAGTFTFTIRATDANGSTRSKQFSITIAPSTIVLVPLTLENSAVNGTYTKQLLATGGKEPYTFEIINTLTFTSQVPNGLVLTSDGLLVGFPTTAGSFSFMVRATDANGDQGTQIYTIEVTPMESY